MILKAHRITRDIKNVGKKQELLLKIYLHLYLSHLVVKVQKTYRKYLQNKCVCLEIIII